MKGFLLVRIGAVAEAIGAEVEPLVAADEVLAAGRCGGISRTLPLSTVSLP